MESARVVPVAAAATLATVSTSSFDLPTTSGRSVRAGVLNLLHDGDFSASTDVERLLDYQVFELTIEWERFRSSRITIVHRSDD